MALRRGIRLAELSPTQLDLEAWLAAPARRLPLAALPRSWRHVEIRAVCPRPADIDARVALLNKVRGALGDALLAGASPAARARQPCPWHPPCALDLLFRQRPLPGVTTGAPPPFTLAADIAGRQLHIALSLFGIAAEGCAAEVADALVRGLRNGLEIDAIHRVPLEVAHRQIARRDGIDRRPPPAAERIMLHFVTPAAPRSDGVLENDPAAIIRGLFNRVVGMARWFGTDVIEDGDWFDERLRSVVLDSSGLAAGPAHYRRTAATQQGGYQIPAVNGRLAVAGDWPPLWPLFAIGEAIHAGGRATQGYGRYRLAAE